MFDPRKANAAKMARRRFESREILDREKARPCKDCGHTYHPCQMDFLRPGVGRSIPIARMLHLSKERLMKEIKACELVCANCSRLRVHMRDRAKRSGLT